jgi:Ca-activated chloride channel homolog
MSAAVNGMTMTIGERVIVAKIKEKQVAKATFEKAKAAGKSASLLSQKRPNVFSMDVANVMPGDTVKVELTYTEILSAEDGQYEFVIPGVVGPRFGGDAHLSKSDTGWISNPYLSNEDTQEESVKYVIDIEMRSPITINNLRSTTHKPQIDWQDKKTAKVYIEGDAQTVGNRDFILRYHLQDNKIVSGLTHYTWQGENYFMLLAEPPKHIQPEEVTAREYFFIVDVSGSMHGFPLNVSTKVMENLLNGLRPTDRFNIMFFAGGSQTLSPTPLLASKVNIAYGIKMMREKRGGGGTRLYSALKTALEIPRVENMSRSLVVVTDGYISADDAVFRLINDNLDKGNLFAFGIGSSVNRNLIEGMAKAGHAESFVVTNQNEADIYTRAFLKYISSPVLTGIELTSPNAEIIDMQPAHIPDLLGERPILVMGKYKTKSEKAAEFKLTGATAEGKETWSFNVNGGQQDKNLPQLWARKRLEDLYVVPRGSKNEVKQNITELGLKYSLLTKHTSFVAVDEVVRNKNGKTKDVKQPLPLPKGVSNLAVGARAMPEPEFGLLLILFLSGLVFFSINVKAGRSTLSKW